MFPDLFEGESRPREKHGICVFISISGKESDLGYTIKGNYNGTITVFYFNYNLTETYLIYLVYNILKVSIFSHDS